MQRITSFIIGGYRQNGQTILRSRSGMAEDHSSIVALPPGVCGWLSTPSPNRSLGSNDPTHGMTPGQHYATVVDFCCGSA
jgi:hypothetical protein